MAKRHFFLFRIPSDQEQQSYGLPRLWWPFPAETIVELIENDLLYYVNSPTYDRALSKNSIDTIREARASRLCKCSAKLMTRAMLLDEKPHDSFCPLTTLKVL